MSVVAWMFFILISQRSEAYPEFIGHGYASCLTCHWSGTGGGGLNDYGRALFASEIAAKPFGWGDDEKLAAWSGFLGNVKTPYWFKPGYKYRELYDDLNPGTSQSVRHFYTMEDDFNLASFTSEKQKFGFIGTLAYVPDPSYAVPNRRIDNSSLMAREYYLRYQMSETIWWYAGFMNKAFGIYTADHTAFNRSPIKLGENDQVHALLMQWQSEKNELFIQPFAGNLHLAGAEQSRGLTVMYEYEPWEKVRYGASARYEKSEFEKLGTAAAHLRLGVGHGHALLWEVGLKKDQLSGLPETNGAYSYLEINYLLARGVNFQSIFQYDRDDFVNDAPDNMKWGLGFVYFPMQRIEWRLQALQERIHQDNQIEDDQWELQAQLHLSL